MSDREAALSLALNATVAQQQKRRSRELASGHIAEDEWSAWLVAAEVGLSEDRAEMVEAWRSGRLDTATREPSKERMKRAEPAVEDHDER